MSFLDSKEQVMKLVLSKHGKEQISKGLFAPAFYGFLDDDVVYNVPTETQNSAHSRIVEETPKNSFITNIANLNSNKFLSLGAKPSLEDLFQSAYGLSTSELGSQQLPRFNYICLRNIISSSADLAQGKDSFFQIPQLNFDLNVFTSLEQATPDFHESYKAVEDSGSPIPDFGEGRQTIVKIFPTGEMVKISKGETIGLLLETNANKMNETFELEFYLVKKTQTKNSVPSPEFITTTTVVQLDPSAPFEQKNSLGYYLDVRTERDIEVNVTEGFLAADGLYDNLPDVVEDFC